MTDDAHEQNFEIKRFISKNLQHNQEYSGNRQKAHNQMLFLLLRFSNVTK